MIKYGLIVATFMPREIDVFPVVAFLPTGIMDLVTSCPRLQLQKHVVYILPIYFFASQSKIKNKKQQNLKYGRSLDYTDNSLSGSVIV